jgi:hypothetical protein
MLPEAGRRDATLCEPFPMSDSVDTAQPLEIQRDLSSTTWLMLACASFVLLGIWFVARPETFAEMPLARSLGGDSPNAVVIGLGLVAIALGVMVTTDLRELAEAIEA